MCYHGNVLQYMYYHGNLHVLPWKQICTCITKFQGHRDVHDAVSIFIKHLFPGAVLDSKDLYLHLSSQSPY